MLEVPLQNCDACYAPQPTIRAQHGTAPMSNRFTHTDVESDLLNINRPTSRSVCAQYHPATNEINAAGMRSSTSECEFPQTHSRLVDPPCTLRASGWNRWEYLCTNPQEGVMMPFDNLVTTRLAVKDAHRPCIPRPAGTSAGAGGAVAPIFAESAAAPAAYDSGADPAGAATITARALAQLSRDSAALPAAPVDIFATSLASHISNL
jgi:hypothetical protein